MPGSQYSRSAFLVLAGAFCLSFLGIADRSLDGANGPQIAFYRAIGQSLFFGSILLITRKKPITTEVKSLGKLGALVVVLMALAGFFLIMSFQFTLVANAIFIISLTPLFAALLAWLFLKERINGRTTIALVIALIGVSIIFGTNFNANGLTGMGFALMMVLAYSGAIVAMRVLPEVNVILLCTLSGLLTILLMLPLVGELAVTRKDLLICLSLGVFQVGLGTVLVMQGAKFVPAAQVSILALIEVVLSPLWVWAFASETPTMTTLIGGAIVLIGVIYQALGTREKQSS